VFSTLSSPLAHGVIGPAVFIALIGLAGVFVGGFIQYVLALLVVSCLVGVSLVMIVGYSRVIMLATGAMMAVGAYGSTILMVETGVDYLITLPIVVLFGLISGVVLAVPCTRFRGHYLAMVTLAFQLLVITAIREWSALTGGPAGLRVPELKIFGYAISSDLAALWLITILAIPAVAILGALLSGAFGKSLRAITASEVAAQAFGIGVPRFHVAAFAISSGALAFAGALMAPRVRILDPETFGLTHSIIALGYPIVGGMGSVWGGLIGGTVLRLLPESLRAFGHYQEFIVATLVVAIMILFPAGIVGLFSSRARSTASAEVTSAPVPPADAAVHEQAVESRRERGDGLAVAVDGVSKRYDALLACDDVTVHVQAGTIHGLIGPNGAGKTTLFNTISGFILPDSGSISIFGRRFEGLPALDRVAHGVTRTFQHVAVFGELSCLDNVLLGRGQNGVAQSVGASLQEVFNTPSYQQAAEVAHAALGEVGIGHLWNTRAANLSLGDQRRLEIARAIISRPKLILLDEPVSGIGSEEEKRIAALLRRLNREHGITILLIEHNIGFVRGLCSTVSVMAAGRVIAVGAAEDVMAVPEVRREYFGEAGITPS
jgi:ABC-type branched-subunit amino acid transport system ATPase component/ABC-type branched-subunit amino acid transport system permease subunit